MKPHDVPDGPLLIDTDVISYWIVQAGAGEDFKPLVPGHEQAISFATYGELLANAHRRRWGERNMRALHHRLSNFVVVPYSAAIVDRWAEMHAKVSGHLHKGGTNDLWTAACAVATSPGLPVVTNNLGDFETIAKAFPDLRLVHPSL